LDEQARQHLLLARFPKASAAPVADRSLFWGVAIFEWGNDVAHPGPASPAGSKP
jgi:hypothetical protein